MVLGGRLARRSEWFLSDVEPAQKLLSSPAPAPLELRLVAGRLILTLISGPGVLGFNSNTSSEDACSLPRLACPTKWTGIFNDGTLSLR